MSNAHARKNPDFLHPIRDKGRKEYIAVSYDQVIRSDNEAILMYLLYDAYDQYVSFYPRLTELKNASIEMIFQFAIGFTDVQLLMFLRGAQNNPEKDIENLKEIRKHYSSHSTTPLRLDIALQHLVAEGYVQRLFVVDPYMDDEKMRVISEIFKTTCNRLVFAVRGDIKDFIVSSKDRITTAFIPRAEDIFTLISNHKEKSKDVYFLCSASLLENYDAVYEDGSKPPVYKHQEVFEKCASDEFCVVDYFSPIIFK